MNRPFVRLAIFVLLAVGATPAFAQLVFENVVREMSVETAYLDENGWQFDGVSDHAMHAGMGPYQDDLEVLLGDASCSAGQFTDVVVGDTHVVVSGDLSVGIAQWETGVRRFFRTWSTMTADFSSETPGTFRFEGQLTGAATAELFILNLDTTEDLVVALAPGESVYSGQLPGNGRFHFNVAVSNVNASDLVMDRPADLAFTFDVSVEGGVPSEPARWGDVKSRYR